MSRISNYAAVALLSLFCCSHLSAADVAQPTSKPNIIFILTDDLGYGDCSVTGNPVLKTPNIDRLAKESVGFSNFVVSPSCSPTRAALMSGKHEFMSGVTHTIMGRERMSLKTMTIAQLLKSAGYATGIFGKWHIGSEGDYRPEKRGFDVSVTTPNDTQDSHFDPTLLFNGQKKACQGFREDILFGEAWKFIEANRQRPFFCYISTYSAHTPCKSPPEYLARNKGNPFYGMISNIDDNLGKLLEKLKATGLDANTLIVLMNDNGGTLGVDIYNAGMRGCKGTPWFGGTRAFSFWRWPGRFEPRTINSLAAHVDLFPTFAELAGVRLPDDLAGQLDGVSLLPVLSGLEKTTPDRMIITHVGRWEQGEALAHKYALCSVHWNDFLLVHSQPCTNAECAGECKVTRTISKGGHGSYTTNGGFHYASLPGTDWALFDIGSDPAQNHNLAGTHPDVVAKMAAAYDQWWEKILPHLESEETGNTVRTTKLADDETTIPLAEREK